MMYRIAIVVSSLFLFSCASTESPITNQPYPALNDERFPSFELFPVESEQEIFYLDEQAQDFVQKALISSNSLTPDLNKLVANIFDYSEMGLLYRNTANSVANTTFHSRAANCLSLSIMTYAMADYAGFEATFYEVDIPEYWTRRDGFSLINGHVNMRIGNRLETNIATTGSRSIDVDFDPQMIRRHFPRNKITKQEIVTMFYNNKGADALIENSYTRAYSYFREAALLSPHIQQSWINLGVLYRMVGDYEAAETSYRYALSLDDESLTAWENLSVLYRRTGREQEADEILAKVESRRVSNPFYHFILGEQALDDGRIDEALSHYRKAYKLDKTRHEVLFGLAKVHYELGDVHTAQRYIRKAEQVAPSNQDRERYQSKLSTIVSMLN